MVAGDLPLVAPVDRLELILVFGKMMPNCGINSFFALSLDAVVPEGALLQGPTTLILRFLSLLYAPTFPDISSRELWEKSLRHRGSYRRVALEIAEK